MSKVTKSQHKLPKNGTTRPFNERLLINIIRTQGQMSKADLTRASGLSAQSATIIVNRLVNDGLLKAGKALKGKVGQPSTPFSLNPKGAISIGIKVGRRSLEVASMSFDYRIMKRIVRKYDFPDLIATKQDIISCVAELLHTMTDRERTNLLGIGIAIPNDLKAWESTVGAPHGAMADWADADLVKDISQAFDLPVSILNDASAACLAEIAVGNTEQHDCFAYFYVGTFIGGGIAIGGRLFKGKHGLAGSIASIPTSATSDSIATQLLEDTSIHYLEQAAKSAGLEEDYFCQCGDLNATARAIFNTWLEAAAPKIAFAAVSAQGFLDPDAIVIDSSLHPNLTIEIVEAVRTALLSHYDHRGLAEIRLVSGENGFSARAIGSGILPFLTEFSLESYL